MPSADTTRPHVALDRIGRSTELIELLRASADLAAAAAAAVDPDALLAGLGELAGIDRFATLAAIEAMAELDHPAVDRQLTGYLDHAEPLIARHAAWRLRRRAPIPGAVDPLVRHATIGGIDTMHAHRTLRHWCAIGPDRVSAELIGAADRSLAELDDPAGRARLVDLLGVVGHPGVDDRLLRVAADEDESREARTAAIGALGERPVPRAEKLLRSLATTDDDLGVHAAIAVDDLDAPRRPRRDTGSAGLRVAQLSLAGELDRELSRGGRGDTGGVASLLVSLGDALARRDDIDHVLTIGRGAVTDVVADQLMPDDGNQAYGTVAFGDGSRPATSPSAGWEHLPTVERGIARVLRNREAIDVLHLRMADVGTLAALTVAGQQDIELCFSLAPDPHNVIQSMQQRGELDRSSFIGHATRDHVWFRARLVEHLAAQVSRLALFPRTTDHDFFRLPDPSDRARRAVVVSEGIDVGMIRRAEAQLSDQGSRAERPGDVLADLAARIPPSRSELPLLVSVGRLSPVKGMDRVVRAWAEDSGLRRSCTLVIAGGSLIDPSPTEASVLATIRELVADADRANSGLILLGGRPRNEIARLLVAAATGHGRSWAAGGVYVDGAYKEEFGLAVIEAMAAGLVVTAPDAGGPPTYVDHGDTGILVSPGDDLGPAIRRAFELVDVPGRARRARSVVEERYSIDTMADRLTELYRPEPALL